MDRLITAGTDKFDIKNYRHKLDGGWPCLLSAVAVVNTDNELAKLSELDYYLQ